MADDYSGNTDTTGTIEIGGSVAGEIERARDRDWFAVELVAGHTYEFELEGSFLAPSFLDAFIRGIYDSEGNFIEGTKDHDSGEGLNAQVVITPATSGTFYISARGTGSQTGTYTLSAEDVSTAEQLRALERDATKIGTDDSERLVGTRGDDIIDALDGDDKINGLAGDDEINGDAGNDWIDGGDDDDTINGGADEDEIYGEGGDDTLSGGTENDWLSGGQGNDTFTGGQGADTFYFDPYDDEGDDTITDFSASEDRIDVRNFSDIDGFSDLVFTSDDEGVTLDLTSQGGGTVRLEGVTVDSLGAENFRFREHLNREGTEEDDFIYGDSGDDILKGLGGSDRIYGRAGDDTIDGGTGSDLMWGHFATNGEYFGKDSDVFVIGLDNGNDTIYDFIDGEDILDLSAYTGIASIDDLDIAMDGSTLKIDLTGHGGGTVGLYIGTLGQFSDIDIARLGNDDFKFYEPPGGTRGIRSIGSRRETERDSAQDLGDITGQSAPLFPAQSMGEEADSVSYFTFTLTEAKAVSFGLRQLDRNADLVVEDASGTELHRSENTGTSNEWISETLLAGTYYVRVEAKETGTNEYLLRYGTGAPDADEVERLENERADEEVIEVVLDEEESSEETDPERAEATDLGDITEQTTPLFPTQVLDADTEEGDNTYFRFTLTEAKTISAGLRRLDRDADLIIEDEGGTDLHRSENAGTTNEWISETLLAGTYYLRVEAKDSGANDYVLRYAVEEPDPAEVDRLETEARGDDFSSTTDTEGGAAVGMASIGNIETAGDEDWFKLTLEAGKEYKIELKGSETERGTLTDPYFRGIYDSEGNLISGTTNDDSDCIADSKVIFAPTTTGVHYLAAGAKGDLTGTYQMWVREVTDDYSADTTTTGNLVLEEQKTARINKEGDVDWFSMTLEADTTYVIYVEGHLGSWAGRYYAMDPEIVSLYDSEGNAIAGTGNDNGGQDKDSKVRYTTDEAGTYYVGVKEAVGGNGEYKISVEPYVDYTADTETIGWAAAGMTRPGEIETSDDVDWFKVKLDAGRVYQIDIETPNYLASGQALGDPSLHGVYDSDGELIEGTSNEDGGEDKDARLEFTPTESGHYYIAATANGDGTGRYDVTVSDKSGDDYGSTTGAHGTLAIGESANGRIHDVLDSDWFEVVLEGGTTYQIDAKGSATGHGTLDAPAVRALRDSEGRVLETWEGGEVAQDFSQQYTPETDGTYYLDLSSWWMNNGTGTYEVSIQEAGDSL